MDGPFANRHHQLLKVDEWFRGQRVAPALQLPRASVLTVKVSTDWLKMKSNRPSPLEALGAVAATAPFQHA